MSELPNRFAIGGSPSAKGSVSDITIFESNEEFHRSQLVKQIDNVISATLVLYEKYPDQWDLLTYTGYQGLHRRLRAITPIKRPANGIVTTENQETNDCIASDGVIVENVFAKMTTLWAVTIDLFSWERENYEMFIQNCAVLTNMHIAFYLCVT
ncbi:hypothetical protein LEN26_003805 [Aphanomyces euteiches]|nr:hypothetical protein AeMF1_000376 [Aphanomyces euteiches]KAH9151739.1 hypothetical protein LEN26_003805 [Aphanomyces euteiches]KAH9184155.1 hypothetical protein AeNC1_013870 [Aphanomyces euteiches]